MKYAHVLTELTGVPWAIQFEKFQAISAFLDAKVAGQDIAAADIRAMTEAAAARANPRSAGAVAVLPLVGAIFPRANLMTEMSGGVSLDRWMGVLRSLVADLGVKAIILDVDSPGGSSAGMDEAAAEIYSSRANKPIIAVANTMMASAAYNLGAAATEVVASPSALVGSIGVYMLHVDYSAANAAAGINPTYISAGRDKVLGNEDTPLGAEGRDYLQGIVDQTYDRFAAAVAKHRGVPKSAVTSGYGHGRVLSATDAIKAGMIDRIATLDETIARFAGGGQVARASSRARALQLAGS